VARRGTSKRRSQDQEAYVAKMYDGRVSPSSGAAVTDPGDVRTYSHLIECKQTGEYGKEKRSMSVKLDDFEKIADEAWSESRVPMMALRIYSPESVLADDDGNVDLAVRLVTDDEPLVRATELLVKEMQE
jgi:hypothetical protein